MFTLRVKPCQCEIASDEVREKKWEPQYKGSRVNPLIGSVPLKMVKGLQRVSKTGQKWPLGHFRWYWACQWTDTLVYMAAHSIVIFSSKFVREGQAILSWQDLNFQHEDQTSTVLEHCDLESGQGQLHVLAWRMGIDYSWQSKSTWKVWDIVFPWIVENASAEKQWPTLRVFLEHCHFWSLGPGSKTDMFSGSGSKWRSHHVSLTAALQ